MIRLFCVGLLLIAYASTIAYFNYYIHDINNQIVSLYFSTYSRYVMLLSISLCMRESILKGQKELALTNPNPENNIVYLMDAINFIQDANQKEIEFSKIASKFVFGNYLKILNDAENDFCSTSDSYNASQTLPCIKLYVGPKDQGMYAAFAFYTDYFIQFSNLVQNSDLSNPQIRTKLLNDPITTTVGIFFNFISKTIVSMGAGYLVPIVENLLAVLYEEGSAFFESVNKILFIIAISFIFVFSAVYLGIFIQFIIVLKNEIWETNGMLNMIPLNVLEKNKKVKEQVINRKTLK